MLIRRAFAVIGAAGLLCGPVLGFVHPAAADTDEPITAQEGKTVTAHEPPITGTYQGGNLGIYADPDLCADPGQGCVILPIKVPKPKIAGETTAIKIKISWTNDQLVLNGLAATSDLDFYLYHLPPTREEWGCEPTGPCEDPGATSWTPSTYGQSTANPDTLTLADPGGNLQLVVANAIGVSNGFDVAVEYISAPAGSVFESLDNGTFGSGDTSGAPTNFSGIDNTVPSAFAPPIDAGPSLPTFAPQVIGADPSLSGLGLNPIDQAIKDENNRLFGVTRRTVRAARSASGFAVLMAMGVFPLVVVALGAFVVLRRRPATLTLA